MDKRSLVALLLIALVIVGGQLLMPRTPDAVATADTVRPALPVTHDSAPAASVSAPKRAASPSVPVVVRENSGVPAETVSVAAESRGARFSSRGATPLDVGLVGYPDL